MAENTIKAEMDEKNEDTRIYEAAFHVIPSLEEAEAASIASDIRAKIEAQGGTILGGEAPQLMQLAYPMQKDIDRKRYTYTSAYFGWVVFESNGEVAHSIKSFLGDNNTSILRSLVVKTTKEAAEPRKHPAQTAQPERPVAPAYVATPDVIAPEKAAEPMTVEAMDAEIAKLVVE
ncbi:MAG: 30S ribosomal protein S6 [Candidatus Pacebacteria bacterium]|nr:30S ribosomal protein S6 [Candidatus Paceibacterota bacterium]